MNITDIQYFLDTQGIFICAAVPFSAQQFSTEQIPENILGQVVSAVSIATPIPRSVFLTIADSPSVIYKTYYKIANTLLDEAAFKLCQYIEEHNGFAFAVPASQFIDWKTETAHLSHRSIAAAAGLGWIGRHQLLITEKYGPAIRLTTVLTDMTVDMPEPISGSCDNCRACIEQCPAHAISDTDYNRERCSEKLKEFGKKKVGVRICGVCIKACLNAHKKRRVQK